MTFFSNNNLFYTVRLILNPKTRIQVWTYYVPLFQCAVLLTTVLTQFRDHCKSRRCSRGDNLNCKLPTTCFHEISLPSTVFTQNSKFGIRLLVFLWKHVVSCSKIIMRSYRKDCHFRSKIIPCLIPDFKIITHQDGGPKVTVTQVGFIYIFWFFLLSTTYFQNDGSS